MRSVVLAIIFLIWLQCTAASQYEKSNFRVICYNVENYFDCIDDSLTHDEEFLPGGIRGWNFERYQTKQHNIARVITAIGGWDAPAIVGLCEVESKKCLIDLTQYSGLRNLKYSFIHHDSPDVRGVDVALLYQPSQFKPISNEVIRVQDSGLSDFKTRDILYVTGTTRSKDTLHVFVCHFPSRLNGELESEERRMLAATVLRSKIDSVFSFSSHSNILIMGDFNDFPSNRSISDVLQAKPISGNILTSTLYNLMYQFHLSGKGTYKHKAEWGTLDQFIVSGNLLNSNSSFFTLPTDAHIFDNGFLLEPDPVFMGEKPFRTFVGMKYNNGFSDHLPIYLDFWY